VQEQRARGELEPDLTGGSRRVARREGRHGSGGPAGPDLLTSGGFDVDNVDIKASGPNGNNGWYVRADGGLEGGDVTVYARCLHVHTG
jgi:hypothetical protein